MNKTIASLFNDINKCCERLSVSCVTGGMIPYYCAEKKNGNVPVADVYVNENNMDRLYDELSSDLPSDTEIKCYETELGKAMDYCNFKTTFIDFSSTQIQHSFGYHVSILPVKNIFAEHTSVKNTSNENSVMESMLLNNNRETVSFTEDIFKELKESYHKGVCVRIPADAKSYYDNLYREGNTVSIREYTYGNCIMSESVSYRDIPMDFAEVLERTSRLKTSLNESRIPFKKEKDCCDKIFDEIRNLFV